MREDTNFKSGTSHKAGGPKRAKAEAPNLRKRTREPLKTPTVLLALN